MNTSRPNPSDFGGLDYHQYQHPLTPHRHFHKSEYYAFPFNLGVLTAPRRRRRSSGTHSRASAKNLISPHNTLYPYSAYYYETIKIEEEEQKGGDVDHDDDRSSDPDTRGESHAAAATTRPASARTRSETLARAWADLASSLRAAVAPLWRRWLVAVLLAVVGMFGMTANTGERGGAGTEPSGRPGRQEAAVAGFRSALDEAGGGLDLGGAVLAPVVAAYGRWLLNTEAETWFAGAREAEDVLEALYVAWTPPSSGAVHLRHLLDERAALRRRAEVRFENFLHARLAAAERLLDAARDFQIYVATRLRTGCRDPLGYRPSRDAVRNAETVYGFVDARVPKMLDSVVDGAEQARRANLTLHHAGARFLRIL